MNRAPGYAEMLGGTVDRAMPCAEERDDQLAHPGGHVRRRAGEIRFDQILRIARHHRVGVWIRCVEVAAQTDDAIEVVAELGDSAEYPIVHRTIRGRVVSEADAQQFSLRT